MQEILKAGEHYSSNYNTTIHLQQLLEVALGIGGQFVTSVTRTDHQDWQYSFGH